MKIEDKLRVMEGLQEDWLSLGCFKTHSLSFTFLSRHPFPRTLVRMLSHWAWWGHGHGTFLKLHSWTVAIPFLLPPLSSRKHLYLLSNSCWKRWEVTSRRFLSEKRPIVMGLLSHKRNWKWEVLGYICCLSLNVFT